MDTIESGDRSPKIGLREYFRVGAYEHVERVLADMHLLGVTELCTFISWTTWNTPVGLKWYQWLLPRLAPEVNVLPCVVYRPPSLNLAPATGASRVFAAGTNGHSPQPLTAARTAKNYGDFVEAVIDRFGDCFEWIELRPEPAQGGGWTLSPPWSVFCEMMGVAAYRSHQRGKKTVLAGLNPTDPHCLSLLTELGVIDYVDAIGINSYSGGQNQLGESGPDAGAKLRGFLNQFEINTQLWITDTGFSTWQHDEYGQIGAFLKTLTAPVERIYWTSIYDLDPNLPNREHFFSNEQGHHFGLKHGDGTPKLLYRLWTKGGFEAVRDTFKLATCPSTLKSRGKEAVLITGGAGFVGTNLAERLLAAGHSVLIFDNLSRPGVEQNLRWLRERYDRRLHVEIADVRNASALKRAVRYAGQVYHFAAQVAMTTSLKNPAHDFGVNAQGTLNLLEALRSLPDPPPLIFTSTNKVYGALDDMALRVTPSRYEPVNGEKANCIGENTLLDFHGPYGCSKGTADQYVLDYARIFGLPTVVFRMSGIYGPHQCGTEDQGWVAHFLIKTIDHQPISIYGDGKQVRDILFVNDLVEAFLLAQKNIAALSGQAFNIGGGPGNTVSLLELIDLIDQIHGQKPRLYFDQWRPGDQRYYVSDITKFQEATGWQPRVSVRAGVEKLYRWFLRSRQMSLEPLLTLEVASAQL
ncbi:MAG: GDP-mannose 4,6-dehydratase [Anaerolineae bacterium]|nr:GDP-mannose 4,6-dehydratase [Anaerolineae bacterium]